MSSMCRNRKDKNTDHLSCYDMTAGPVSLRQVTQTDILSSISRQFKDSQQSKCPIATQIGAYCAH